MSQWDGFSTLEHNEGLRRVRVSADYGGTDDDPTPLAVLLQDNDIIELNERELRWLVAQAPRILERMGQRP